MNEKHVRIFSYGAGVQSFATLVLQTQGKLPTPYDVFIFANVGHDSENPATLEHYENVAKPLAAKHGIRLIEVQKTRKGELDTVYQATIRDNRSIPIPVYMPSGAPGNRTCTTDFKILVVDKWIKSNGYTHAVIGLGISTDETHRVRSTEWQDAHGKRKFGFLKRVEYPLINMQLSRNMCHSVIADAGLEHRHLVNVGSARLLPVASG